MPYIKQEIRSDFDGIISDVLIHETTIENSIKLLMLALSKQPSDKIDGCLNYIFTQLLRTSAPYDPREGIFIRGVIIEVYTKPLTYEKINRFNGLITCMMDEFKERGWDTPSNIAFLFELRLLFKGAFTEDYERKKMEENGDLERIV